MENVLTPNLNDKHVLLGITGGVAAYKAAELCRLLVKAGARVQVIMSRGAQEFVGPATFAALTGERVITELFDEELEANIGHIQLADRADLLLVAPATAHVLAKFATGLADDMLTTLHLACRCPVLVAPAMNVHMWEHAATRRNVSTLLERGVQFVGPASGEMACGHVGDGRLAEPDQIVQAAGRAVYSQDLRGKRILVTAGGTRERIDPVRFLSNRSSGKMGYAIAAEASSRGADVVLVSGPTALPKPYGVERVDVIDADQMAQAVHARVEAQDVIVMAAAVADYKPTEAAEEKLKKADWGERPNLGLQRTEDILGTLASARAHSALSTLLVGFAAETGSDLDRSARDKLNRKDCDLLVANDVSAKDAGFAVDTNRVVIYHKNGEREALPLLGKRETARRILDRIATRIV